MTKPNGFFFEYIDFQSKVEFNKLIKTKTMDSYKKIIAFKDDSLGNNDAVGLAEKIKNGDLNPQSITQDAIERAQQVNPHLNAIAVEDFDSALERSKESFSGGFKGVPTFIKDTDQVLGLPIYLGSRTLPGDISNKFSKTAQQVLATGLNHLGTTTTPEFGLTGTTESMRFGATRNPWNTATLLVAHQEGVLLW